MADLHFVDFALIPSPARKEKQFRLPDDLFDLILLRTSQSAFAFPALFLACSAGVFWTRECTLGSLSKRTFQGDAVVKSAKARDSRRRSRAKFNLLSTGATRLGGLHSQILACLILLSLLWYVLTSFVRFFFSYYNASLISDEDYIILYELFSSRNPDIAYENNRFESTWMK